MKYKIVKFKKIYAIKDSFVVTNLKGIHFSKMSESIEDLFVLPWVASQGSVFNGFETIIEEYELGSIGSIQTIKEK